MAEYSSYAYGADVASSALQMVGRVSQSRALREQGRYQQAMHQINAANQRDQAEDAKHRGQMSRAAYLQQAKGLIGKQRAKLAAQGVAVNEGSALELQGDTAALAAADALQIRNNSFREAWGYNAQAASSDRQGRMARSAANFEAQQNILTGVSQFGSGLSTSSVRYYDANR